MPFFICALVLVASLLLGGGTHNGFLSDAILQIVAIPALWVLGWQATLTPSPKPSRWALAFCWVILAVPAIQLIPLPPKLWADLPGRAALAEPFKVMGRNIPWMPMSVAPYETWLSAFSFLPPIAIFVGTVLLDARQRRAMSLLIIALGVVSAFVGLLQATQAPSLRFFDNTDLEAVGFFANRNHFAALLYAVLLFAAAWSVEVAADAGPRLKEFEVRTFVVTMLGFLVLVIVLSGEAMARSRAGVGLTIAALLGAIALALSDRRAVSGLTPAKLLVAAGTLAIIFAAQYALFRILQRFEADPLADARIAFARNTFSAARAYMPLGSGLGSFVPVYGSFEHPQDTLADTFANRAHNDVLELWLETGAVGLIVMGVFIIWFIWRAVGIWRGVAKPGSREIDRLLARAATLVIALLLAHSFVDYPLRTAAMAAIMAFACGLLVDPPVRAAKPARTLATDFAMEADKIEALLQRQRTHETVAPALQPTSKLNAQTPANLPAPPSSGEPWGADIEWPEAWRQPTEVPPKPAAKHHWDSSIRGSRRRSAWKEGGETS